MSSMTLLPTLVFPFQDVLLFPPESAPVATKSSHATPKGLIEPLMFGPNITGKVMVGGYQLMTSKHTGAFFGSDYGTADYHGQDGRQNVPTTFGIDASRSSAVYGRSSTVQPASTRMLLCIKI